MEKKQNKAKQFVKELFTWKSATVFAAMAAIFVLGSVVMNYFEMKMIGSKTFALMGGGIVFSGFFYIIIDVVNEVWGKKTAWRLTIWTMVVVVLVAALAQILVALPGTYAENNEAFKFIFSSNFRIVFASEIAFLAGIAANMMLFNHIRGKQQDKMNKKLFVVRSVLSTILAQGIDTFLFLVIAFAPVGLPMYEMPWLDILQVGAIGVGLELVVHCLAVYPAAVLTNWTKKKVISETREELTDMAIKLNGTISKEVQANIDVQVEAKIVELAGNSPKHKGLGKVFLR